VNDSPAETGNEIVSSTPPGYARRASIASSVTRRGARTRALEHDRLRWWRRTRRHLHHRRFVAPAQGLPSPVERIRFAPPRPRDTLSEVFRVALACLPLLAVGCTFVLSPDEDQCETAADCEDRGFSGAACVQGICSEGTGGGGDPVWGCLGNVVEPTPDPSQTVALSVRLAFASGGEPVTTATVDFCDKLDIACTGASTADFPKGLVPDADGNVSAAVRQGFDGFVRIASPEIVDSRVYVGRPIVEPPKVKEVQLLRPMEYSVLANLALAEVDPTRGTAIILVVDCKGDAVSGVRFETPNADADTVPFYLINQAPTIPPTANATDRDGFGGFFNMPVSAAVARAFRAEDEAFVGESSFQIVANTISYVQIAPTPQ
jgi:hypothetical protein